MTPSDYLRRADTEMVAGINARPTAASLMQTLCREIGPRPPGSAAMREAANLLAAEWQAFGMQHVHTESVPVMAWDEAESSVTMLEPNARAYPSIHCANSAAGIVEGELVDVGNGGPEDLERVGQRLPGAIALLKGHVVSGGKYEPLQKRVTAVEEAGAAAVLLASAHAALPAIQYMYRPVSIPVLGLAGDEAGELADLVSRTTVRGSVEAQGCARDTSCVNLIGEMGTAEEPNEVIILSAHLDGYYLTPCAFDNLSGIVTLTEIARALAPYAEHFARTLRVIAYTGEEFGFAGSREYVQAHPGELDRIRFVLNLDSLFDDTAKGLAVMGSPEMREYLERAVQEFGMTVDIRDLFCMSSDYLPFVLAGIPAARPASYHAVFPPWSHTAEDTEDKIDAEWLKQNAVLCARSLLKMLTDREPLPSRRRTSDEVSELIRSEGVEEALGWLGFH